MASPERNVQLRYLVIDHCLAEAAADKEQVWTKERLLHAINQALLDDNPNAKPIAMRTLEKDLVDMVALYGVNILSKRRSGKVHYGYANEQVRIHNGTLQRGEAVTVQRFLQSMERFEGIPEWDWWTQAKMKLKGQFGLFPTRRKAPPVNRIEGMRFSKDERRWYEALCEAAHSQFPLRLAHAPNLGDDVDRMSFLPERLVQQADGIFVLGTAWDTDSEAFFHVVVALDEITSLDRVAVNWPQRQRVPDFAWGRYVIHRMGVQSGIISSNDVAHPVDVRVWVAKRLAQRFLKEPMHASQDMRIESAADGLIFNLVVVPDAAFKRFALQWGSDFQVLEPDELRHEMRLTTKEVADRYAPMFGP